MKRNVNARKANARKVHFVAGLKHVVAGFKNSVIQDFKTVTKARLFVAKSTYEIQSQFNKKGTLSYEPVKSHKMQSRVNFCNTMIDALIFRHRMSI